MSPGSSGGDRAHSARAHASQPAYLRLAVFPIRPQVQRRLGLRSRNSQVTVQFAVLAFLPSASSATSRNPIPRVIRVRAGEEMIRPKAEGVVAGVPDHKTCNGTFRDAVRVSVRELLSILAISVARTRAPPNPAIA